MSVRIRNVPQDGKDTDLENKTVYDVDGYKYHLGPNEHMSSMDDRRFAPMASNATVYMGSDTQQTQSPDIQVDLDPGEYRS